MPASQATPAGLLKVARQTSSGAVTGPCAAAAPAAAAAGLPSGPKPSLPALSTAGWGAEAAPLADRAVCSRNRHQRGHDEAHPNLRKTRMCPHMTSTGHCHLTAEECRFAHSADELRVSYDRFYKVQPCAFFDRGKCRNGDLCRFAHGEHELRGPRPLTLHHSSNSNKQTGSHFPLAIAGKATPTQAASVDGGLLQATEGGASQSSFESEAGAYSPAPTECLAAMPGEVQAKGRTSAGVALFLSAQNQRRLQLHCGASSGANVPSISTSTATATTKRQLTPLQHLRRRSDHQTLISNVSTMTSTLGSCFSMADSTAGNDLLDYMPRPADPAIPGFAGANGLQPYMTAYHDPLHARPLLDLGALTPASEETTFSPSHTATHKPRATSSEESTPSTGPPHSSVGGVYSVFDGYATPGRRSDGMVLESSQPPAPVAGVAPWLMLGPFPKPTPAGPFSAVSVGHSTRTPGTTTAPECCSVLEDYRRVMLDKPSELYDAQIRSITACYCD